MRRPIALLFVLLSLLPLGVAAQQPSSHNLEVGKNLDIFNTLYSRLDLFYVDTLNPVQTMNAAINGMLRSLDPYTEYYPEDKGKDLQMMLTGKYAGIGALVKYHSQLKRVVIDVPYEGMPAAEAGLRKGDIILSIDDTLMTDKTVSYVSSHLRGDAGTTFLLRVKRPSTGKEMKMKVTRRNIKLPELPYYGFLDNGGQDKKIGYIKLEQFTEDCAKEVRRAFVDLRNRGAQALVFDLRGNGGGSEMEAVDIVNIWVPQGQTVVENRGKVRQANHAYTTRFEPVDTIMPLVVLVDGETASASEITSGALQDLDRAVVLGTRTYGKGLVQVPMDLPYNTNVKITTSKYFIPSGRCIQAVNYGRSDGAGYKERIPDSLTHVFYTRGGREVRDGGGIKPDVEVKPDSIPNIAYYLSTGGLDSTEVMFDYEVDYISRHQQIAPAETFRLTDDDWAEFRRRVVESGFTYDALSRTHFNNLVKAAKFEGYYDEARDVFDALEKKLNHDVGHDLDIHRSIIQELMERDIVQAYYYQRGAIQLDLRTDNQVRAAVQLLNSSDDYQDVLRPAAKK